MVHTEARAEELFNGESLLETFMGDREVVRSTLARFMERTGEQIRAFPELEKRGAWEDARREAHTIRGSALTLFGEELGQTAFRLQLACEKKDLSETAAAFSALEAAFARFREKADAWLLEGG